MYVFEFSEVMYSPGRASAAVPMLRWCLAFLWLVFHGNGPKFCGFFGDCRDGRRLIIVDSVPKRRKAHFIVYTFPRRRLLRTNCAMLEENPGQNLV